MNIRKLQWREVAPRLKRKYAGKELHHVFGRLSRLLACEAFIVGLSYQEHHGPDIGKISRELKTKYRDLGLAFDKANRQNVDPGSCWWANCEHSDLCPLARRARVKDVEEMRLCSSRG